MQGVGHSDRSPTWPVAGAGAAPGLLQWGHLAMDLLKWNTEGSHQEHLQGHKPDKQTYWRQNKGSQELTGPCWALIDGPSPTEGAAKYLHSWVLSLLLRCSLREALTALGVTKG